MSVGLFFIIGRATSGGHTCLFAADDAAATLMSQGKQRQFAKGVSVRLSNSLSKQLGA